MAATDTQRTFHHPFGKIVMAKVSDLRPNPWNPRRIMPDMLASLKLSLRNDPEGLRDRPCIAVAGVDYAEDGTVIAGNQRLAAATSLHVDDGDADFAKIPTVFRQYTEQQAKVVALRDNNSWGEWDDDQLAKLLKELDTTQQNLDLTGFGTGDLENLLARIDAPPPEADPIDDRGSDLALADVSIGDPKTEVTRGDVWDCGQHVLVCTEVYDGWPAWVGFLEGDALLVPYPTPTLPLTVRANRSRLVMVQPDPWLAGHVLDKYAAVRGADTVKLREPVEA